MDFTYLKQFLDHMAAERSPGNAVAVYQGGKLVYEYASGYADLESKTPLKGDELFNIYSCSKVATVTAGVQLLERGQFLLTDPLYEYIPEFRHMQVRTASGHVVPAQNPITIGQLFTMTAGFNYNTKVPAFEKARQLTEGRMDTVEVIKCLAEEPLSFEPGTHWQYSLCHDVLAGLISVVSGQKFRDYVRQNIFEPLEMTSSVYHHTDETRQRTASQYTFVAGGGEAETDIVEAQKGRRAASADATLSGTPIAGTFKNVGKEVSHIFGEEYDSGGAGIITNVTDYAKLMAALAGFGVGANGERILSAQGVELMRTNQLTPEQMKDYSWRQCAGCGYGLGVRTHMDPAKSGLVCSLGEFGWGGAAGATVIADPSRQLGVFYAQHCLSPREEYYQPRLRNVVYTCLD